MKTITPQLPTILGSFAAMLIAFLSLMTGTSPGTCMMKAMAAFLVFAGFGLILRFALGETFSDADEEDMPALSSARREEPGKLDMILPGTSVADLLGVQGGASGGSDVEDSAA